MTDTHNMICDFGKHNGERYTRIPVSYLKWMVNSNHSRAHIAQAELDRRGTVTPDMEISGHAIDRASLNCLDIWRSSRNKDEGISAWLIRMSAEALKTEPDKKGRFHFNNMLFAFEREGVWPVLKTVMRSRDNSDR